jgi:competence ComEA-like helix-hairpin-helix protein
MPLQDSDYKNWVKDYFTFNKWQRRSLVLCLLIIVACIIWPAWQRRMKPPVAESADQIVLKKVEALVARNAPSDSIAFSENTAEPWRAPQGNNFTNQAAKLFLFDPNTATADEWLKLGLREKTVQTILNYRSKGGKFRKPEDLLKIYGLPKSQAAALLPYVVIAAPAEIEKPNYPSEAFTPKATDNKPAYTRQVNINSADTSVWIALPGIGSKLASRIVNFREKLGGFYSIQQVGETYGVPDSTFQKIKSRLVLDDPPAVKRINVNTATADELRMHPYIKWNIANAIVQYRNQHGPYQQVNDLLKIVLVDDAWLKKVSPYLTLQ